MVFGIMTVVMLALALIMSPIFMVLMAILCGALTVFSALHLMQSLQERRPPSTSGLTQERSRIVRIAAHQEGRITAEEASMKANIPVAQAEALLDELVADGRAENWVSDSGNMVYVFRGLLEDDKANAEDPMAFLEQ